MDRDWRCRSRPRKGVGLLAGLDDAPLRHQTVRLFRLRAAYARGIHSVRFLPKTEESQFTLFGYLRRGQPGCLQHSQIQDALVHHQFWMALPVYFWLGDIARAREISPQSLHHARRPSVRIARLIGLAQLL